MCRELAQPIRPEMFPAPSSLLLVHAHDLPHALSRARAAHADSCLLSPAVPSSSEEQRRGEERIDRQGPSLR